MASLSDSRLTRLGIVGNEAEAGKFLYQRLRNRGPAPYSLCEACLNQGEFDWLTDWALQVAPARLSDALGNAGLILTTFIAEWNRRYSGGDTVWQGLAGLFGNDRTRTRLFTTGGDATAFTRNIIEDTARRFKLRNAFDEARDEAQRWYITIQLQYGFSRRQFEDGLGDWLRGHRVPEAVRRLLEPEGHHRSRSFQELFSDLRYFRRDYLTEVDLRRRLEVSPWVLFEWVETIATQACRRDYSPSPEEEEFPEILSPPQFAWDGERGPYASCRLLGIDSLRPEANHFHLRHEGRLLASWFRQIDGTYFADRKRIDLPIGRPEAILRLEDPLGDSIFVQTISLWSASEEVQVKPLGRTLDPVHALEAGKDYLLILAENHRVSDPGVDWYLAGRGDYRRRWVLLEGARPFPKVLDEENNIVWQAEMVRVAPKWAEKVRFHWLPNKPYLELGSKVSFDLLAPKEVRIDYVCCSGSPLEFQVETRGRTSPIRLSPELAGEGCKLRVGLSKGDQRAVLRPNIRIPTRGLAKHADQQHPENGNSWEELNPNGWLTVNRAASCVFRIFTDGPDGLVEGHLFHRRLASRPGPLGRLLGTGKPIRLVDQPFNTLSEFSIASNAIDFGIVRSFDRDHSSPERFRLELLRSIQPTDRHELVLWSSENGLARVGVEDIEVEQNGRAWTFPRPWKTSFVNPAGELTLEQVPGACSVSRKKSASEGILCGLAFEGYRLGFGWQGQWHRFFSVESEAHPTLSDRQRISLIRWFRLPGLLANRFDRNRPLFYRLVESNPVDLLDVVLFDEDPVTFPEGLVLHQDGTAAGRELFDLTARELLVDVKLTGNQAEAIERLFHACSSVMPVTAMITRLFSFYPLVASRVLHANWFRRVENPDRPKARQELRGWRMTFAGAQSGATKHEYLLRRDILLEDARRTLSEAAAPVDAGFVRHGLVRPAISAVLDDKSYQRQERGNLLIALGSAAFRHYLGLQLLEAIEDRL